MNRAEFMRRLAGLLGDVPPMEREEAIQYYNDYFDDAGEENESSVIASLGTPEELARSIKAGLSDGGNGGEFTESGFSGYAQTPKDEIIRTEDVGTAGRSDDRGTWTDGAYRDSARRGGPEYGRSRNGDSYYKGAYYSRPEGDGIYGGRTDTRNYNDPYGQNGAQDYTPYGQGGPRNGSYGPDGSGAQNGSSYGPGGNGAQNGSSYGPSGGGAQNGSYGPSGSGTQNTAYGQGGTQYSSYGQSASRKEGMSGGMIVLIVILAVLTSPVWIGLLGGLFGLAAGVIATLFALFLSFLIIGVVFIAVSVALLVTGISLMFSAPAGGLCVLGCAFGLFAVGLLAVWLMVIMAGMLIPACIRGMVSLCRRIFRRGGARA